jgi:hypothetical protein
MGVMDFEVQRERRAELLREAESGRLVRNRRAGGSSKGARGFWKLASAWVLTR